MFELSIDINYNCLFLCPFCSSSQKEVKKEMDLRTAKKCLDFIKLHNSAKLPVVISITGGEPVLSKNLSKFVAIWAEDDNRMILCTTGGISVGNDFWKRLKDLGLQEVRISLPSVSGKNCFEIFGREYNLSTVEKNIDSIRKAELSPSVNFIVSRLTIENFNDILIFCKKRDLRRIRMLGLSKQGRALENWTRLSLTSKEESDFVEYIDNVMRVEDIDFEFSGLPNHKWCSHSDSRRECLGGIFFFHVLTNGDVYPCPSVKSIATEKLGSVFSPQDILYCERQCQRKNFSGLNESALDNLKIMV